MNYKLFIQTSIVLLFFASNSLIARAALIENYIDAYSFTFLRVLFGAITLIFLLYIKEKRIVFESKQNWLSSFFLFLYAISFSYAYINLDAGVGALTLFTVVQLLTISWAIKSQEKIDKKQTFGIALAIFGLIYILYPSEEFELSTFHIILMILSGIGWAVYTLIGKASKNALLNTSDNFTKAVLFCVVFYFLFIDYIYISMDGIILSFLSGAITSAIGYALWYYVLPQLKIVTSGVIQLSVPPIAIFLGTILLNEQVTVTLIVSSILILFGIFISIKK